MARPKGQPKLGGRAKGTPNKATKALKEMILTALEGAHPDGGVGYLTHQAKENPTAFLSLVGKVLPMTIAGDHANPLVTLIELVAPQMKQLPQPEIELIEYSGERTH